MNSTQPLPNLKRIRLKKIGTGEPDIIAGIEPGATGADVLRNVNCTDPDIVLYGDSPSDTFGRDEVLWGRIKDGQVLNIGAPITAGA